MMSMTPTTSTRYIYIDDTHASNQIEMLNKKKWLPGNCVYCMTINKRRKLDSSQWNSFFFFKKMCSENERGINILQIEE